MVRFVYHVFVITIYHHLEHQSVKRHHVVLHHFYLSNHYIISFGASECPASLFSVARVERKQIRHTRDPLRKMVSRPCTRRFVGLGPAGHRHHLGVPLPSEPLRTRRALVADSPPLVIRAHRESGVRVVRRGVHRRRVSFVKDFRGQEQRESCGRCAVGT